jgi:hypothetical protein
MYDVKCDTLSKDGATEKNARATLSDGKILQVNGSGTMCIHFWTALVLIQLKNICFTNSCLLSAAGS